MAQNKELIRSVGQGSQTSPSIHLIPEGTMFNKIFRIGARIASQSHADVYEVSHMEDSNDMKYEARVFDLRDLSLSYRRYRTRAMNRLSKRSICRASWNGLDVIIYMTGPAEPPPDAVPQAKDDDSLSTDTLSQSPSFDRPETTSKEATDQQHESRREKQRDRRRAKRQKRRVQRYLNSQATSEFTQPIIPLPESKDPNHHEVDDQEFAMLSVLLLAGVRPEDQRYLHHIPLATVNYPFEGTANHITIDTQEYISGSIKMKEREIMFLRQQYWKLRPVIERWRTESETIGQKQHQLGKGSAEWNSNQINDVIPFMHKYHGLKAGLPVLLDLIQRREEEVQAMKRRLMLAQKTRDELKQTFGKVQGDKLLSYYQEWILEQVDVSTTDNPIPTNTGLKD
ncbi:hypothetical protein NM208_g5066 [Fusarium decemcellulare]|uniref:Uncharacterized protein n=1 Tax=Fusarium decemcellulare TaxID=57161 RepID=A0ACC1SIK0_9HYPO|nr:hypothetical protein NM208_g5066 [Fusarium decemcellulare]